MRVWFLLYLEKEYNMVVKKASVEKKTAKKKVNKGDSVVCELCGFSSVSEEFGGVIVAEDTELLCCSKPLKKKMTKAKSPVK